nr:hypothetical protein [Tanacetum cinerariifolium]
KTTGKSTQGSKSHQKTVSESAPAEEPMQTIQDLEEPSHQEFETSVANDQPIIEASQHLEWLQQQKKPPTPDRACYVERRRDDADKDEEPSVGSDRGSKRRREGKKPESTSALKEKRTKTTGKSTQGSKSHQKTVSESAPAEEP